MSNFRLTLKLLVPNVKLHLILGKTTNILPTMKYTTFTVLKVRTIARVCDAFSIKLKLTKIKKLCNAASTVEKIFWKLLKGQRFSSQMSSFLVGGKFITDKKLIREMWAGHFEELGTPSENIQFDSDFLTLVIANV